MVPHAHLHLFKMKPKYKHITILGGGPAGMAVAFYAHKKGMDYRIFESSDRLGGNCITLERNGFLFDSGAHRLHDKDTDTTNIIKELLGPDLNLIHVPSQIYREGRYIDFPLSPLNLIGFLGPIRFVHSALQILHAKLKKQEVQDNFRALALNAYGRNIAELFLLHYTEKLWGKTAAELSTEVAGKRLKGLNLKTFILEAIKGKQNKTSHLDGSFYYPKYGIGAIFEKMQKNLNKESICLDHEVITIHHKQNKIIGVTVKDDDYFEVQELVCSLPLGVVLNILDPAPQPEILRLAKSIQFRDIMLLGFFLDKESVNNNGSMYFPSERYPFTRVYEPRNRSTFMSPKGKTSLMVEIPCQRSEPIWNQDESELLKEIAQHLIKADLFREDELLDSCIYRVNNAYPILEKGYLEKIKPIYSYLSLFENLHLTGRNGLFAYTHIHDHMVNGRNLVNRLS